MSLARSRNRHGLMRGRDSAISKGLGSVSTPTSSRLMSLPQICGNRKRGFCEPTCSRSAFSCPKSDSLDSAGTVSAFWKTLFGSAKVGARFVYTDNGAYTFNDYFDDQWKKAGLQCLVRQTDARMPLRVVGREVQPWGISGKVWSDAEVARNGHLSGIREDVDGDGPLLV